MFLGREKELSIIKDALTKKSASVMVYGKRKIGKTTLITHSLKGDSHKTVYYECLKAPMKDNVEGLISVLLAEKVLPARRLVVPYTQKLTHRCVSAFWCRWRDSNPHDVATNGF